MSRTDRRPRPGLTIAQQQAWITLADAIHDHREAGRSIPCVEQPDLYDERPSSKHPTRENILARRLCRNCSALDACRRYHATNPDTEGTVAAHHPKIPDDYI